MPLLIVPREVILRVQVRAANDAVEFVRVFHVSSVRDRSVTQSRTSRAAVPGYRAN